MIARRLFPIGLLALTGLGLQPADELDTLIRAEMERRQIVGLSLAIIDDGRIAETRTYGYTRRGGDAVSPTTLFQAGSISKPVAAVAALQLVEQGKLALDENVNARLTTWKVPDNEFTATEKVTLRRLLSHSAGLTVHGFPGYALTERMPSAVEVLDGKGNTPAVRVNLTPGSTWRYSGGGYTVMQQLVADVAGEPFEVVMRSRVLEPLGMTASTYQQPLPAAYAGRAAVGHLVDRTEVAGRWHAYPEMAAAGLWTTPTDLARYAIGVQQMLAGKSKVLSAATAREMLTVQKGSFGLGLALADSGRTLRFSHGGRDEGFDATLIAYAETGDGVVIMINGNDNSRAITRIVNFIARRNNWPGYPVPTPERVARVQLAAAALHAVAGRYEESNNNMSTFMVADDGLYTDVSGLPDERWLPTADGRFVSAERAVSLRPLRNAAGQVEYLEVTINGKVVAKEPRVGPLFTTLAREIPDSARSRRVLTALQQLGTGGDAVTQSSLLSAGARRVFVRANPNLAAARALELVHVENVQGRGIERHGHAVAEVLHYRVQTTNGERLLIVHLDEDGVVTDYDLVNR